MDVKFVDKSIIGLGIDQGIAHCGYSVIELTPSNEMNILCSGTLITSSKTELTKRIESIYQTIKTLAEKYNVSIIGCEKLFFSTKQKSETNPKGRNKSASIVYTNMITGILYLIAGQQNIEIKEFVPGTVKKYVTGHGKASKEDVKKAVEQIVHGLDKNIETDHEGDSIAIGVTAVKYKKEYFLKKLQEEQIKYEICDSMK